MEIGKVALIESKSSLPPSLPSLFCFFIQIGSTHGWNLTSNLMHFIFSFVFESTSLSLPQHGKCFCQLKEPSVIHMQICHHSNKKSFMLRTRLLHSKPPLIYKDHKPQIRGGWMPLGARPFPISNQLSIDYDYQCWARMAFTPRIYSCV